MQQKKKEKLFVKHLTPQLWQKFTSSSAADWIPSASAGAFLDATGPPRYGFPGPPAARTNSSLEALKTGAVFELFIYKTPPQKKMGK